MHPWICALLICISGGIGGVVNAFYKRQRLRTSPSR